MKKYATSVILQSYSSSKNARSSAQLAPSPKTDGPVVVAPPTRNRLATDPTRGFPSPKSSHTPGLKNQRRSPFPDYHEEHQTWLSLSGNEHNQSTDAEQQSMLASVLEPETHHKLKKLVEDQKHQSFSRPSNNKAVVSAVTATTKPSVEDREDATGGGTDDDGAMSDRTQATAQLWSTTTAALAVPASGATHDDTMGQGAALSPPTQLDEHALHYMSIDDIMNIQVMLQREMERRVRSAANNTNNNNNINNNANNNNNSLGASPSLPPPPMPSMVAGVHAPIQAPTMHPSSVSASATPSALTSTFIDQQAVESRKTFKRTKSGGNESAFNNPRSRTPQPKTMGSKLDLHATVEKEDPELLSVHSDVLNTSQHGSHGGSSSQSAHLLLSASSSASGYYGSSSATNGGSNKAGSGSGNGRPVSRTNGALHPHDKMLYGHRNTALPCLSPMDQQAQSSPLDFTLNSRSSSRPPSRGVTLANFEDRLSTSLGGSQTLGGNLLTAATLASLAAAADPSSTNNNASSVPGANPAVNASVAAVDSGLAMHIEGINISSAKEMTLDQYLTSNRPTSSSSFTYNQQQHQQQQQQYQQQQQQQQQQQSIHREVSRGELVLSPFCAFDDISLGSQSVNSSISSRQQRRHRRRDSSATATSSVGHR